MPHTHLRSDYCTIWLYLSSKCVSTHAHAFNPSGRIQMQNLCYSALLLQTKIHSNYEWKMSFSRSYPKWKYYSCIFWRYERCAGIIYSAKKTVVRLMSTQKLALNRMQKLCSIMHIYYSNWLSQNKETICLLCTPTSIFLSSFFFYPILVSFSLGFAKAIIKHTHIFVCWIFSLIRIYYTNSALLIGLVWVECARACVMTIILWFFFFRSWCFKIFFLFYKDLTILFFLLSSIPYFSLSLSLYPPLSFWLRIMVVQNRTHYW